MKSFSESPCTERPVFGELRGELLFRQPEGPRNFPMSLQLFPKVTLLRKLLFILCTADACGGATKAGETFCLPLILFAVPLYPGRRHNEMSRESRDHKRPLKEN